MSLESEIDAVNENKQLNELNVRLIHRLLALEKRVAAARRLIRLVKPATGTLDRYHLRKAIDLLDGRKHRR